MPEPNAFGSGVLFPVSVKGVLLDDAGVVLLENERGEWELPGGKLEIGESPEECLAREITRSCTRYFRRFAYSCWPTGASRKTCVTSPTPQSTRTWGSSVWTSWEASGCRSDTDVLSGPGRRIRHSARERISDKTTCHSRESGNPRAVEGVGSRSGVAILQNAECYQIPHNYCLTESSTTRHVLAGLRFGYSARRARR